MSIKRAAIHSLVVANNSLGGANKTKSARFKHGLQLIEFVFMTGRPISDIRYATAEHLKAWIEFLKLSGIKLATLNNKVASVRALIGARGVDLVKAGIADSKALGLEKRIRAGNKIPITDQAFQVAIDKAMELNELGFVHVIKLERYLGLRGLESLMSTHQLKKFARDAWTMHEHSLQEIHIVDGTKGGRPRHVQPLFEYAWLTIDVISAAVAFGQSNSGYLLEGPPGTGLKGARARYHRLAAKCGLTGKCSPHALRYRYATDKYIELFGQGVPRKEAERIVLSLIGHGMNRKTLLHQVYLATVSHTVPPSTRAEDIAALAAELEAMKAKMTRKKPDA